MKTWLFVSMFLMSFAGLSQAQASTICVGETVYGNNGSDLVGQVANIFGDQAQVHWLTVSGSPYSGEDTFWSLETLSPEVECGSGFCENAVVYGNNGSNLTGTISRIFENGKVEVRWNSVDGALYTGAPTVWDASTLSAITNCTNGICAGQVVYGNNGSDLVGTVAQVFANGKVAVQWASINGDAYTGSPTYWDASTLSPELASVNGIDAGDTVHGNNGSDLIGTVLRVFANGKAQVRWLSINGEAYSGAPTVWDAATLQKSSYCSNDSCHRP